MQDTKNELIIILLPNSSRVLTTEPTCETTLHSRIQFSFW